MGRRSRRRNKSHKKIYLWIAVFVGVLAIVAGYIATQSSGGNNPKVSPLSISTQNPVLGSKTAQYTIYEFGEYQCPLCGNWFRTVEPSIVKDLVNTGQTKLVWRDFIIYGPDSRVAANAAYAAGEQGKYWEFHDLLFTNQGQADTGWVTQQLMVNFAQRLGLNVTQFTQSMNTGKFNSLIDSNLQAGQQAGVQGTPTFFVVGPTGRYVTISGSQPESVFQQAINSLGSG